MALRAERALPSEVTGPVDFAELAAEPALPAGVMGPRDLAPLRRLASICLRELMSGTVLHAVWGLKGGEGWKWLILGRRKKSWVGHRPEDVRISVEKGATVLL